MITSYDWSPLKFLSILWVTDFGPTPEGMVTNSEKMTLHLADGAVHNVLFGQYDSPVSKNWNPKTTFPWEKLFFLGYFSYVP